MARSKRAKRSVTTPSALLERLPDRFCEPDLDEDLLGSLRAYIDDLTEWLHAEGVRPDRSRIVAIQIMAEIGTSPADWYRYWMDAYAADD